MTLRAAFELALLVISGAIAMMLLGIVVTKSARVVLARRHARLTAEVRPSVLAAIDERGIAPVLDRRRRAVAESIAISLLPKLRGADRDSLAQVLVDTGIVGDAVAGLSSRSAARRQRSAELLGNAGIVEAERDLAGLLADRDVDVRITAARALGRIGEARSVGDLFLALADRRVPVNAASMAVLRIGAVGEAALVDALDSPRPLVRSTAAELAGSLGLITTAARLEELLDDVEPVVRASAVRALGRLAMPTSASPIIVRLELIHRYGLEDPGGAETSAMVVALGRIGHRSAIPVLEASLMRRPRLSRVAAEALAGMGARRSITSQRERAAAESEPEERETPWAAS